MTSNKRVSYGICDLTSFPDPGANFRVLLPLPFCFGRFDWILESFLYYEGAMNTKGYRTSTVWPAGGSNVQFRIFFNTVAIKSSSSKEDSTGTARGTFPEGSIRNRTINFPFNVGFRRIAAE